MIVLAIDSAMNGCSVSLCDTDSGTVLAQDAAHVLRGQAELLVPMINDVIENAGQKYSNIEMVAVTKGPGAFTGMRIAMATAKSLGLALDVPVVGVCTFKAVLDSYQKNLSAYDYVAVILETKRKDFYVQVFDAKTREACSDKAALTAIEIQNIIESKGGRYLVLGDAFDRLVEEGGIADNVVSFVIDMPESSMVAFRSAKMYKATDTVDGSCAPEYIRPADVSISKNVPRTLI